MKINFIGAQCKMTKFQCVELGKLLELKECSELVHCDVIGSEVEGADLAVKNGVNTFSIYPISDPKKRQFWKDLNFATRNQRIETDYIEVGNLRIKWYPTDSYMKVHQRAVDSASLTIACPKEFKYSVRSATWGVIKYVWKLKKDIIIIPPIERPYEEEEKDARTEEVFRKFES